MAAFVSIMFFIILAFIIISFVVYNIYYRSQANKALETGVPAKTLSPSTIFLVLVIFVMFVVNIVSLAQINDTEWALMQANDQINALRNDVSLLQGNLEEFIETSARNAYNVEYTYNGREEGEYTFEVSFNIKEITTGSTVTLIYKDYEDNELTYTVSEDELLYSTNISLHSNRYKVYLKIEHEGTIYYEQLETFEPIDYLEARFLEHSIDVHYKDNLFEVSFMEDRENITTTITELDIVKVELYVWSPETSEDGETFELTESHVDDDGLGFFFDYEYVGTSTETYDKTTYFQSFLILTDSEGTRYSFSIEPEYRSNLG